MSSNRAVAYLRSSKDRADVSISAQRQELEALAITRNLSVVHWYEDAVQSGSKEDRPAFSELISAIKNPSRGWSTLLVLDTSRIARGRYIAQAFKHECRRRGVELIIAKVPETDPVSTVILEAVLEAMDEVHSIMSREKGLAGMRENVRRGWRAGGRAPWGYQLEQETSGAVRDGRPVMKTKLILNADADKARAFLADRAAGIPRVEAMRRHRVELSATTLIDIEWNALVYAGHTVWNRHTSKKQRGQGKAKRRNRAEWVIQRDTHPALISEAQAEAILAQIQSSDIGRKVSEAKSMSGRYLLSGLLVASDGRPWVGAGIHYRLKPTATGVRGKRVPREAVEQGLIARIRHDLQNGDLVQRITDAARQSAIQPNRAAPIKAEIEKLERRKQRAALLSLDDDGDTYVRAVRDITQQIDALRHEAEAVEKEDRATEVVRTVTPAAVREAIFGIDNDQAMVRALVRRVVLDPDLNARIEYGLSMASPRQSDRWAGALATTECNLAA